MDKLKEFEKELSYIRNSQIKEFTEKVLLILPEYFWEIPTSSTGKYHPSYSLGTGGLIRHTKAAIKIAIELFRMDCFKYTEDEKDMIISALFLHDGKKRGNTSKHSSIEHPLLVISLIKSHPEIMSCIDNNILNVILNCISTHMGQWCFDHRKNKILPIPETKIQRFVHLCDYMSSRKFLEVNFEIEVNRD